MNRFFRCFCINLFGMGPLQYHSSRSDFGFEFTEIFVFEKWLPAINDTGSCQLRVSVIRGVADSPYQWYTELLTHRIVDTGSQLLNFLKENSPYRWYGESSTTRISDTVSRRLPVSLSWGVNDSAYHWYGELTTPRIVESGSRHSPYWWVGESLSDKNFYNRKWMRSSRLWIRSNRMWMRSSRLWIRSSRMWMRSSRVWMRSSRVVDEI